MPARYRPSDTLADWKTYAQWNLGVSLGDLKGLWLEVYLASLKRHHAELWAQFVVERVPSHLRPPLNLLEIGAEGGL